MLEKLKKFWNKESKNTHPEQDNPYIIFSGDIKNGEITIEYNFPKYDEDTSIVISEILCNILTGYYNDTMLEILTKYKEQYPEYEQFIDSILENVLSYAKESQQQNSKKPAIKDSSLNPLLVFRASRFQ